LDPSSISVNCLTNIQAVILDSNENLQGIITIEDLLEEIVGDIVGAVDRK